MKVYVDANPKRLCVVAENGETFFADAKRRHTSNEAEYIAVIAALMKFPDVKEICTDSELVVKQLNGEYKVKKPELKLLNEKIVGMVGNSVKFTHVSDNPAGRLLK